MAYRDSHQALLIQLEDLRRTLAQKDAELALLKSEHRKLKAALRMVAESRRIAQQLEPLRRRNRTAGPSTK